jgi:hypothetical protein
MTTGHCSRMLQWVTDLQTPDFRLAAINEYRKDSHLHWD